MTRRTWLQWYTPCTTDDHLLHAAVRSAIGPTQSGMIAEFADQDHPVA